MLVLVLDTSSAAVTAGIADVGDDVTVLAERVVHNARGHGEHLAPLIADCLAVAGAKPSDLGAVVAGTGPGPFTGLRVGLVTAAMFAETLGLPAYGVCSLDALADPERRPAVAARRDRRPPQGGLLGPLRARRAARAGPAVDRPAEVACQGVTAAVGAGIELYDDVLRPAAAAGPLRDGRRAGALRRRPGSQRRPDRAADPALPAPSRRGGPRRAQAGQPVTAATIVAMTPDHIDELMAYEREMFGTEAWTAGSYRDELADTRSRHYVAAIDEDGALVGWAGVRVVGASADILTVGVVPRGPSAAVSARSLLAALDRRGATAGCDRGVPGGAGRQRRGPGALRGTGLRSRSDVAAATTRSDGWMRW